MDSTPIIKQSRYSEFLKEYVAQHEKPSAIVMISSLWSSTEQAVSAISKHEVSCNFTYCPEVARTITYPATGDVELSDRILTLLSKVGIFAKNPGKSTARLWKLGTVTHDVSKSRYSSYLTISSIQTYPFKDNTKLVNHLPL